MWTTLLVAELTQPPPIAHLPEALGIAWKVRLNANMRSTLHGFGLSTSMGGGGDECKAEQRS